MSEASHERVEKYEFSRVLVVAAFGILQWEILLGGSIVNPDFGLWPEAAKLRDNSQSVSMRGLRFEKSTTETSISGECCEAKVCNSAPGLRIRFVRPQ